MKHEIKTSDGKYELVATAENDIDKALISALKREGLTDADVAYFSGVSYSKDCISVGLRKEPPPFQLPPPHTKHIELRDAIRACVAKHAVKGRMDAAAIKALNAILDGVK